MQTPVHAPLTHAWFTQLVAWPHVPAAEQVWNPLPTAPPSAPIAHCVSSGAQTPVHAPLTHAWFTQLVGVPQVPATHDCVVAVPEHCTAPVVQEPEQAPMTHVEFAQTTAGPQMPSGKHVATPLPASTPPSAVLAHRVAPGVHPPASSPASSPVAPVSMASTVVASAAGLPPSAATPPSGPSPLEKSLSNAAHAAAPTANATPRTSRVRILRTSPEGWPMSARSRAVRSTRSVEKA